MENSKSKYINLRIYLIAACFSLFFGALCVKAVHLQVIKGAWLSEKAESRFRKIAIHGDRRGTIYDSNKNELAVSVDVISVAAYPKRIKYSKSESSMIASALELPKDEVIEKLSSNKSFVWLKRHASPKEIAAAKALKIKKFDFITEDSRFYTNKSLAAQVLGFAGTDGSGLEGLEYYYDSYLKGDNNERKFQTEVLGRDKNAPETPTSSEGNNLILTIDSAVQYIAENALSSAAKEYSAKSGMAVVMKPETGDVLAIAHYPAFNPNSFGRFDRDSWRNRAITDPFEPGSTMKIFLAAAALESGYCNPDTIFFCENGKFKIGRHTVNDTHPSQWLSLQQIIKHSSNIGAVKISQLIGREVLYTSLINFGFGNKTGIDCPGETAGIFSSYKRWSEIDFGAISFGQGISVSAIQLVTAASAIANDGVLMKPRLVKSIVDDSGKVIKKFEPKVVRNVVSPDTARKVKRIMQSVVTEGGTGFSASLSGYTVCGKTGTAQKPDGKGKYSRGNYNSSFLGFAPENDPEIAVLVVLDEPRKQYYGSIVAAPAFKSIMHKTLNYMNIQPERMFASKKGKIKG